MDTTVERPDLNAEEAEQLIVTAKVGFRTTCEALFELRERRGWVALGYESWRTMIVDRFTESVRTIERLVEDAEKRRLAKLPPEKRWTAQTVERVLAIPETQRKDIIQRATQIAEIKGIPVTNAVKDAIVEAEQKTLAIKPPIDNTDDAYRATELKVRNMIERGRSLAEQILDHIRPARTLAKDFRDDVSLRFVNHQAALNMIGNLIDIYENGMPHDDICPHGIDNGCELCQRGTTDLQFGWISVGTRKLYDAKTKNSQ
jgi:hypothetical protein